jgi:hypothetical protein
MNKKILLVGLVFLLMISLSFAVGTAPDPADAVAYYPLENLTDSLLNFNLTNVGSTSGITGIINDSYSLDGTGNYLNAGQPLSAGDNTWSMSLWFNLQDNTTSTNDIFSFGTTDTDALLMRLNYPNVGENNLLLRENGGAYNSMTWTGTNYYNTGFRHLIVTSDGTNVRVFVDNVQVGTNLATSEGIPTYNNLYFGVQYFNSAFARYWDGDIDEVGLFDVNLTTDERTYLYQSGTPATPQQYPFTSPSTATDEIFPQVIESEQSLAVEINSNTYQDIFSTVFEPLNTTTAYSTWVVQLEAINKNTVASCRAVINGTDYNTEINQSLLIGDMDIIYLFSDEFNVTQNQSYVATLQCKRDATGGARVEITEAEGQINLLATSNGTPINTEFGTLNLALNSSTFTQVFESNFTTSNYTGTDLVITLVTDGEAKYIHDSTSTIEIYGEVDGVAGPISQHYGTAGTSGTAPGLYLIKNVTANSNATIKIYAKSSSSDGNISVRFALAEIFTHVEEANINDLTNTAVATGTWATLDTLYINNSGHTTSDIVVKAAFNAISLSGSQQLNYRIKSGTDYSQEYTIELNTAGVSNGVEHHLFPNPGNVNTSIEFQAYTSTSTANITAGSIMAYIVDEVNAIPQFYAVQARNDWDNASITAFNVTLSSGTKYQSNATGYVNIFHVNGLDTFTVSAADFFNQTIVNHNTSTNVTVDMYQSDIKFNVTEIITNNTVLGNITIGAVTQASNTSFYLSAGSYSATFQATGYFDVIIPFNVTALDNLTIQSSGASGTIINVTATQKYTGTTLENFTVNYEGINISYSGSGTATGEAFSIPLLQGYAYNVTVSLTGYITQSQTYTPTTNNTAAPFELHAENYITIQFLDEITRLAITNVNYTLTSSDFGFIGSTTNGTVVFQNLLTDRFNLEYTTTNYTSRNHIFYVPLITDSITNRSLYLLENTPATDFVLTVTNKLSQAIEGVTASLLRQYVINNETVYEVVEMMLPSVALDGATRFSAEANFVPYLFRIQDENQNILFQGSGTTSTNVDTLFLIDQEIFIKVDTGTSPFDLAEDIDSLQYSLTNSSSKFWFSYTDAHSAFSSYHLKVFANGSEVVGETNSTSASAVISVSYTPNNATTFRAIAFGIDPETGTSILIDSFVIDRVGTGAAAVFGALGWFILFLSLIIFTIGLSNQLVVAVLMNILAILAFSTQFIGIVAIGAAVQGSLFFAGLVVIYLMRKK